MTGREVTKHLDHPLEALVAEEHHMPREKHRYNVDAMICYEEPIGSLAIIMASSEDDSTIKTSITCLVFFTSVLIIYALTLSHFLWFWPAPHGVVWGGC
jgi:hypothetical protein